MRDSEDLWALILMALGLFTIISAFTNWELFWESRTARPWVNLFGKPGARVFYIILGLLLIAGGAYLFSQGR